MHNNDRISKWETVAAEWAARARETGRSPAPRARHLRARSRRLATALAELRKRCASATDLAREIDALVIEETAADAANDSAANAAEEGRAA